MTSQDHANNPYNICIFLPDSICKECPLKTRLDCKFNLKKLLRFILTFLFTVIAGSIGLLLNGLFMGFYIFLIILVLFSILFFEFWEIKILCTHCPFYAEKGRILHCYANYGSLKIWNYNPKPMDRSEKIQLIAGFILFYLILFIPSIILIINNHYLWAIPPIIGLLFFSYNIKNFHCSKCFNFSCPLNNQPKDVIDEFLRRNPVMRDAWEERGWQIEEE